MTPSKAAIEAAILSLPHSFPMTYAWTETVLKAAYAIDFAALQKELNDCVKSHQKVNAELNEVEQENDRLRADLEGIAATFASRKVTCEAHDPKCDSLCCLVHSVASERDRLRAEVDRLKTELHDSIGREAHAVLRFGEVADKCRLVVVQREQLEQQLADQLAEFQAQLETLAEIKSAKCCQKDKDAMRSEIERLKQEASDNELSFNHANEIIGKYEQTVTDQRAEIERLKEEIRIFNSNIETENRDQRTVIDEAV